MNIAEEHEHSTSGTPAPLVPAGLHRYHITELCWESPHAFVFCGRLKERELRVLIKVAKSSPRAGESADWLLRDYHIAEELTSTCVAKPFAIERADTGPALIFVDEGARPVESVVRQRSLQIDAALTIGSGLIDAVAELHQERLVHANLNTTSVWLHPALGTIRISDFSCARHHSGIFDARSFDRFVDVRFIAPEQIGRIHRPIDQRTDVYSIGIILFNLLTGTLPFDRTDPLSIVDNHLTVLPRFPAGADVLPLPLANLVLKCLAKNPNDRYSSARGLKIDLKEILLRWRSDKAFDGFELGRHDAKGTLRIPRKLYGRELETNILRDFVKKSRAGRPAILLVKGAPGVGKSAFLNQVDGFVRQEHGRFVSGKFDQYKQNVPYLAFVQAFQQLVHQLLTESETQLAAWKAQILSATASNAQVIIDVIPEVELITGPQPPVASLPPLEARNRFNRVVACFTQAFARPGHPLCILMDDLQWADSASLELLSQVLADGNSKHLLFVGAYRPNEVGTTHPLQIAINDLTSASSDLQTIQLNELRARDVLSFIEDTFAQSSEEASTLTDVLYSRSQGNPLYLTQLISFLYDTDMIAFDYSDGRWNWDLRRIQGEAVTEDILDLLDMRIRSLPPNARKFLSTAACVGNTFETEKVAAAAPQANLDQCLAICVRMDLLVALDNPDGGTSQPINQPAQPKRLRFLHDRIQQAAFELIPASSKKYFRLQIGRRLLALLAPEDKARPQIDVLSNLNYAWDLINTEEEKLDVARLNLVAGRKARDALAYKEALRYLTIGLSLLDERAWKSSYELVFQLHASALECEYLNGSFDRAEALSTLLLERSRSKLDRASIYLTKILLHTTEERYEDAIEIGIQALRLFGIRYRRNPKTPHLLVELALARVRMGGRQPSEVLRMRALTDPDKVAAIKILVALFPTAYFLSPNLLMFSGLKVVNYSLRHGISPLSANGFVLYGLGLGAAFDQHRVGYEFGKLAVELAELEQHSGVICKVLVIFSQFIKFWRDPIDTSLPLIERARKLALHAGDHQYVNYAIIGGISLRFSRGTRLTELLDHCDQHAAFVMQSKDAFPIESFLMWKSSIFALIGKTKRLQSLDNDAYDENTAEERYRKTGNLTLLSYQYTLRLQIAYLFGRYQDALAISDAGQKVISSAPGYITVADHYLYRGLAAAANLATSARQRRLRGTVRRCLERLNLFAANCPQNFLQYATLLNAELASSSGKKAAALKLYNKTIELAEEQGFIQLVALANERAAFCCFSDDQRRLGLWYLESARAAYSRWDAVAKVAVLDREIESASFKESHPHDAAEDIPVVRDSPPRIARSFDVAAAAAVSQLAAVEEKKDRILSDLIEVIRSQAGAEITHLIVASRGEKRVEASATAQAREPSLVPDAVTAGHESFSPSIVNYVMNTATDLFLDVPHLDSRFSRCDYLARHQPSSVMCIAVIRQLQLLGVIYLENRRIIHSFDQERLDWVRILTAEVASTVLTDKLGRYREYLRRFAPPAVSEEIDGDLHSPNLAAREKDVSILFADLAGYTQMHELMEQQQTDRFVNRAFSEFVEDIQDFHGVLLSIYGDELFALFQDEDPIRHVRNACHAALSIARTAARFNESRSPGEPSVTVNMGINAGPAAVGLQPIEVATGARWRYDATGPTVNVAARIRALAHSGGILISAAAADRIEAEFQLQDRGEHVLRHVSKSVRVYRLLSARKDV
jgi:predicted ATPase/class 3 adenylate cyclase